MAKIEYKQYRELDDEQLRALVPIEQMKPGYQLAIRAALETYVAQLSESDRSGAASSAQRLLQALKARD